MELCLKQEEKRMTNKNTLYKIKDNLCIWKGNR